MSLYPLERAERDRWILARRGARASLNPEEPYGYFVEDECDANGKAVPVATILLTNRECPWRCVMCDLWKNTLAAPLSPGAIPAQIEFALSRLPCACQLKLYNSGSFFDRQAIPWEDYGKIARLVQPFSRVIVESHPTLVSTRTLRFRDLLQGRLEVAMGLETANPNVLQKLNKGMTLDQFSSAAELLRRNDIDLRAFILLQPPFLPAHEALYWAKRSIDFAFDRGATVATLIPTRSGNGAMELLEQMGQFTPPNIRTLEAALAYGIGLKRGRVFAALWNLQEGVVSCPLCFELRAGRLQMMNLAQFLMAGIPCTACGSSD